MNIGAIGVFEGEVPLDRFIENVESKIHLVPRYRQIVVPSTFGISRPTWEFDPQFDARRHIFELELEPPGTLDQLFAAASKIHERRLDRAKPLWELYLVRGLEGGSTGMIAKVHHCMVDGVGGISLLLIVLDPSPEARPTTIPADEYRPSAVPGEFARFTDAFFDALSEGLDAMTIAQERLLDVATGAGGDWLRMMGASLRTALPYFLSPRQNTPFNRSFSGHRAITGLAAELDEVFRIRRAVGGTVNDVALTVLGGALRRYLEEHGEDVSGRIVRVLTPVNVRRAADDGTLGNHFSMLVVDVPVGETDPLRMLRAISDQTARLKREHVSAGVQVLSNAIFAMPVPLSRTLIDLGALPLDRIGNMVCTNVPGPRLALYTIGHKMTSMYPIVPIGWEMGIGCAIASYDQTIYLSLTADTGAAPDAHLLKQYLVEAYVELRDTAGVGPGSSGNAEESGDGRGGVSAVA